MITLSVIALSGVNCILFYLQRTSAEHCDKDDPARPDVRGFRVVLRLDQDLRRDVRLRAASTLQQTLLALNNNKNFNV
jgi:hypothetical protein